MMQTTNTICPRCRNSIGQGTKFCSNCGNDISGVWGGTDPALGGTIAVEADPHVDVLGQLLSEATLGDYDVYGELGRGGMAAVYLALDLALNRKVAIKTMLPELVSREGMVQRFKREAQTSASLNHPHIIQIYTVKQSKQLVYFVMKFIEGRSLESVIHDKGQVPLEMAQVLLSQVGSALAYAHRKGVVHRDIKPANIMIDEDGWAIVTDFGIAKVQEAQNLTATGTAIGTPHYMSPEQFHNKSVTGQSDQYSLGIVAYEMLSGRKPFDGGTYAEIITQHLFEQVPDLRQLRPELPEHVVATVNKMMSKDPAARFPDLDAAVASLGSPSSKQEGDIVRTQMISLAKSGPQRKVRLSVPMSPIPVQKQRPAAPAPTAVEKKPVRAAKPAKPRPEPAPQKSRTGLWVTLSVVGVVALGGGAYVTMNPGALSNLPIVSQQAQPQAPTGDALSASRAQAPAEPVNAVVEAAPAIDHAQIRADSIREATARTEARRLDSIRIAQAAEKAAADRIRRREAAALNATKTPASEIAAVPRAPVANLQATGTGKVKIASGTANAFLYINNDIENVLSSARDVTIPAGIPVRLSIRAQGCQPWDTTVTVAPGSSTPIGRRFAKC